MSQPRAHDAYRGVDEGIVHMSESKMEGGEIAAALDLLTVCDLETCGHADLDRLAGAAQRVRGYVAAFDARLARRRQALFAETSPPADPVTGPCTTAGDTLDLGSASPGRDRRPGREVERDRARAEVGTVLPIFEAALGRGEIDAAHLDAVATAWRGLDTDERGTFAEHGASLLGAARAESPERFGRRCRDLARRVTVDHGVGVAERQRAAANVRRWIDRTGIGHLHAELDPETTARIWAALDAHLNTVKGRDETAGIPLSRLEVDALTELVCASSVLDARVPALSVVIDHHTLRTGAFGPASICETSDGQALTPAAVRRLACEAGIIPVVLGGDGVPLDVGRTRRLATGGQRRALAAMYATCGLPDCGMRFERCRIHHLDPWLPIGPTNLDNLIPVCDRHHHQIHDGGWHLTMTPDRVITLRAPDGTIVYTGDTRDRITLPDPDLVHDRPEPDTIQTAGGTIGVRRWTHRHRHRPDHHHDTTTVRPRHGP
jgi:hypothetical protein